MLTNLNKHLETSVSLTFWLGKSVLLPWVSAVFSKVGTEARALRGVPMWEDLYYRTEITCHRAGVSHLVTERGILCLTKFWQRLIASENPLGDCHFFVFFPYTCQFFLKSYCTFQILGILQIEVLWQNPLSSKSFGNIFPTGSKDSIFFFYQ